MTWSEAAKKGLIKWSQYGLPTYRKSQLKTDEETFEFIRDCYLEKMPANLKEVLVVSDEKFESWYNARKTSAVELLTKFQLAGDAPYFLIQSGDHYFAPAAMTVGNHWTSFNQIIEQLSECILSLEATKALRADYLVHLAKEISGAKKELEAALS